MSRAAWADLAALGCGVLFALGLGLSGMTDPGRVRAFLDVGGAWDPSLALVMVGAIAVHAIAWRWARRRDAPLLAAEFRVPARRAIDGRLLGGAALFGVGWGIAGFCPGPALVSLAGLRLDLVLFVGAMLAGMAVHAAATGALQGRRAPLHRGARART